MKKISVLAALILVLSLMLAGSAGAAIVEVPDPGPQYWDSSAQAIAAAARNGNPNDPNFTKADYGIAMGVTDLSTPANIYNAVIDQWTYGHRYYFTLEYVTTSTSYPFPTPKYTSFTVTKDANPPSSSNLFGAVADLFGDNLRLLRNTS